MDDYLREVLNGCEVRDYVIGPDDYREVRLQNMAANNELARRYPDTAADRWGGLSPSGESVPYAVEWVDTCTGQAITVDFPPFYLGPYGWGFYGRSYYGGEAPTGATTEAVTGRPV